MEVNEISAAAYAVPTDAYESDGTFAWDKTTMVLVEVRAGDMTGIGYTYADNSAALLIRDTLAKTIIGLDPMNVSFAWQNMIRQVRNLGRTGICAMAVSAVDNALWDLKAKLLDVPLVALLGAVRAELPIYGSGGFTSYSDGEYGYELSYFREMMEAGAVDVVMAGATRCCGISGFLKIGALCESCRLPMSSHCAPLLHLHPGYSLPAMRHAEYFHDHVAIERMFFEGFPKAINGALQPDLSMPGFGIIFRHVDAEPYRQKL